MMEMKIPKPIGIRELIDRIEKRIEGYEKSLEETNNHLKKLSPQNPVVEVCVEDRERIKKRLEEDKEALKRAKKLEIY